MRRPRSLRTRVALTALVVLTAWVAVLTVGVDLVVASRLRSQADDVLRARAEAAAATVDVDLAGTVSVRDARNDAALDVGTWIVRGDQVLESPTTNADLDAQAVRVARRGRPFAQTGGDGGVRWHAEPVLDGNRQVATVVSSLSLAPYQATEELTLAGTAVLALLLLGGGYLAVRAGVGRALQPVGEMTHQAARWSADDVDRRFGPAPRPTELDDLAATMDGVLDRLSAVLRHEKQLSAEISHELRTPMSRVLAELELLRAHPRSPEDTGTALASVEAGVREMGEILETLLVAARSDSSAPPGRCDPAAVVRGLVDRREGSGPPVRVVAAAPLVAGVDAAVLERALSPLLDNASRFARSLIEVRVTGARGHVRIEVRDDGPGIAAEDLPHVFEPGRRGTSPDGHQGAGLGLALSRRLLTAAGGSVTAAGPGPGAALQVTLPAA